MSSAVSSPIYNPSAILAMQGPVVGGQAFVRHQHKRSQPGDLLTTANQYFTDNAAKSRPASAAVPAAPAQAVADTQTAPMKQCAASQSTRLDVSQSIPWFLAPAALVEMSECASSPLEFLLGCMDSAQCALHQSACLPHWSPEYVLPG